MPPNEPTPPARAGADAGVESAQTGQKSPRGPRSPAMNCWADAKCPKRWHRSVLGHAMSSNVALRRHAIVRRTAGTSVSGLGGVRAGLMHRDRRRPVRGRYSAQATARSHPVESPNPHASPKYVQASCVWPTARRSSAISMQAAGLPSKQYSRRRFRSSESPCVASAANSSPS